jgi:23S rRNA-/tRNA-specific pseudouridylate synthase
MNEYQATPTAKKPKLEPVCNSSDVYDVSLDMDGHLTILMPSPTDTQRTESFEHSAPSGHSITTSIPESVLQYERQKRKTAAAKRASQPLDPSKLVTIHIDDDMIAVNKPSGFLSVPGINANPNMLHLVHEKIGLKDKDMIIENMIIHRLDMDTSGVIIYARTKAAMSKLQGSFRDRKTTKKYEALVVGHISQKIMSGRIELPLQRDHRHPPFMRVSTFQSEKEAKQTVKDLNHAGYKKLMMKNPKPSTTEFEVKAREYWNGKPVTRLTLVPVTGRTHQLRVHCAALGYPIVGDPAYGIMGEASSCGGMKEDLVRKVMRRIDMDSAAANEALQVDVDALVKENAQCMCLHARELRVEHPTDGQQITLQHEPDF